MSKIAGFVPFTTIDYPNKLAAVIFFQGCPLSCPFCHNPALQPSDAPVQEDWEDVFTFLKARTGRLDGVVLSGGEALMQLDIVDIARQIKELGFKVGLHTAGVYPQKLEEILPYTDWVGLDIKAPLDKYHLLCGRAKMTDLVMHSLDILLQSHIDFEARTTLDPRFLVIEDVYKIADLLINKGVSTYTLQKYRTYDTDTNPPSIAQIEAFFEDMTLLSYLSAHFKNFAVR